MTVLYRLGTAFIYALLYPYGRIRAALGSVLWKGRLARSEGLGPVDIWLHAASVGEVKVAGHLISYLNEQRP
ncbi:MAG: 3-deoxy-D-manno-octulosonic acid transferase, partial [candidate division Zixibacteria bacterium]|nr:3-deoxy-D-manno-octulosonic acid transferase [candidate division Zixibacteria bacterium]